MNKWQKKYCDEYYKGKIPNTKQGKETVALLGDVKDTIIVEFPKTKEKPAHIETYIVTEDDCDIPNGKISVSVLVSNLVFWKFRGYKVTSK